MHIVGIDPGVVHTGCVRIVMDKERRRISCEYAVFEGVHQQVVADWAGSLGAPDRIFIERYDTRRAMHQDKFMIQAEQGLKDAMPKAVLVTNYGVKKLIPLSLLSVFGLDKFDIPTHHNDLMSAARIALIGTLKFDEGNLMVSDIVRDALDGKPWDVVRLEHVHELDA